MAASFGGENSNAYGSELGAGGKFRKRLFRKSQTTPYDRPQTSARNPGISGEEGGEMATAVDGYRNWWIRPRGLSLKALIGSSLRFSGNASRKLMLLYSSGRFRKLLSMKNDMIQVEGTSASVDRSNLTIKDGCTDLEQILKQKTFTRSEIDRLSTLLWLRATDSSCDKQEQKAEKINVKTFPSYDRPGTYPYSVHGKWYPKQFCFYTSWQFEGS